MTTCVFSAASATVNVVQAILLQPFCFPLKILREHFVAAARV